MTEDELKATIGQNVAHYRIQAGLTQEQLSEMAEVTTAFISQMERGKKMMRIPTLRLIATALDVSCDALLFPRGPEAPVNNIIRLISKQPQPSLEKIEKMIRLLVEEPEEPPSR